MLTARTVVFLERGREGERGREREREGEILCGKRDEKRVRERKIEEIDRECVCLKTKQ